MYRQRQTQTETDSSVPVRSDSPGCDPPTVLDGSQPTATPFAGETDDRTDKAHQTKRGGTHSPRPGPYPHVRDQGVLSLGVNVTMGGVGEPGGVGDVP